VSCFDILSVLFGNSLAVVDRREGYSMGLRSSQSLLYAQYFYSIPVCVTVSAKGYGYVSSGSGFLRAWVVGRSA